MPIIYSLFLVLLLIFTTSCENPTMSYQILSQGQQVQINLQNYFKFAKNAEINEKKSTPGYQKAFNISKSINPYRMITNQTMQFSLKNNSQKHKFSDFDLYDSKSIYNQPIKLFLLSNNILVIYIYQIDNQQNRKQQMFFGKGANFSRKRQNQKKMGFERSKLQSEDLVAGLNLTEKLSKQLKNKKVNCSSMETQMRETLELIYISCRVQQTAKMSSFILLEINLTHNMKGFINGISSINQYPLAPKTQSCQQMSLKHFPTLQINNIRFSNYILAYCSKKMDSSLNDFIYYWKNPSDYIIKSQQRNLKLCLLNSTYVTKTSTGFLSLVNKQLWEYYTNFNGVSRCYPSDLNQIQYLVVDSRTYGNIEITYILLSNNSVIIKSSYRTNYQKFYISRKGFKFTSLALTEHFMAITMVKDSLTLLLIYSMSELYPKLIDEKTIKNTYQSLFLFSTGNYLEKGYYVFCYNKADNTLMLNQYDGYVMNIKPQPQPQPQPSSFPGISLISIPQANIQKTNKSITQQKSHLLFPQGVSINYTLYIQAHVQDQNQLLIVNIVVRNFNDPSIVLLPPKTLIIDSPYVNLNLSSLVMGPLQRFYIQPNPKDPNMHIEFINYFNTINISNILNRQTPQEPLKQIAINLQLKISNPSFSLYYSSYIQTCTLKYMKKELEFSLECQKQDKIHFNSFISDNSSKIIIISKERWIQYNTNLIELCSISGETGQCNVLMESNNTINKIKEVQFRSKANGYIYIELFIMYRDELEYGYFDNMTPSMFNFTKIFTVTKSEVPQLQIMDLKNFHFDKNFERYLLLHLSFGQGELLFNIALLFDRPSQSIEGKFLAHLLKTFPYDNIESIMTIDRVIIILYRFQNNTAEIIEYKVTQYFTIYQTRSYPLYGRKIIPNGNHISDGNFIYIEVRIQSGPKKGKSEFLVYCPAMSTTNILTHIMDKNANSLSFIQQIGVDSDLYQHSIGTNGNLIFAIAIPNLQLQFDYNSKSSVVQNIFPNLSLTEQSENQNGKSNKKKVEGNLHLKLVDFKNTLYELIYTYVFDISQQTITYTPLSPKKLYINSSSPSIQYKLQMSRISGPVMSYALQIEPQCPFIKPNIDFSDIFTKMHCLLHTDSKQYGDLLDMSSISLSIGVSLEIVVTTKFILCVENKVIKLILQIGEPAQSCSIINKERFKVIIVCDKEQGSYISVISFGQSCLSSIFTENIPKPHWLTYQYFKMKFSDPHVIFQVPIRIESNKVYFITTFDLETRKFSEHYLSLVHKNLDHFLSKDFQIDDNYAYVLQQGLGIYNLKSLNVNETEQMPLAWISLQTLGEAFGSSTQIVYIKPEFQFDKQQRTTCGQKFSNSIHIEIGTVSHTYKTKICFNDDTVQQQFQIIIMKIFKQYKDCKNNILSKSKSWGGIILKLCILELEQHRIFSNYMPIFSKSSEYYVQFYSINFQQPSNQSKQIHPFRMEKINTNDTFEIKQYQGELIVSSLFNFMCYYQLATSVVWNMSMGNKYMNENYEGQKRQCKATLSFGNQNFVNQFELQIINTDDMPNEKYKPWIFRGFFIGLALISIVKAQLHFEGKKKKLSKMRNNIISNNQFEFKVRLNSKKSLEVDLLCDLQDQQ